MKTITISFKAKEKELFEFIAGHSSPAAYLKDLALREMMGEKVGGTKPQTTDTPPPLVF